MPYFESKVQNTPIIHIFMVSNEKLFHNFRKHFKGIFTILVIAAAPHFLGTLTSLNSISKPNI